MNMEKNPMREFEDIAIPVPWGHIAGRWYGKRNVRPILAIHGFLNNYGTWDNLIPLLPPHIGVLAIDLPGHGKSSHLPAGVPYHALNFIADIIRVIEAFKWDKVSIMSHSMSSRIAILFAAFFPNRVDMLIQFDGFFPVTRTPNQTIKEISSLFKKFMLEETRNKGGYIEPPSYPMEEILQRVHKSSAKSIDLDKCIHVTQSNITQSKLNPNKYYFSIDPQLKYCFKLWFSQELYAGMVECIRFPHLLIKATNSDYVDLNDPLLEMVQKSNQHFELHIVDGTHHVHLNNPQAISSHINKFICKWMPPATPMNMVKPQPQICPPKPQDLVFQKSKL